MDNLKKLIKIIKEDNMIKDSFILLVATMIMNISGFLYHFVMGRLLDPAKYGILGATLSMFYILLVPLYVIQTSISKFVAEFNIKKDKKSIGNIFVRSTKKLFLISILSIFLGIIISFPLASYLKMPVTIIWIVIIAVPFMLLLPINRGLMQGLQNFKALGWNFIIEAVTKFVIGLILVFIGMNVFGAVFGIVSSYIIAFILGFFLMKRYFKKTNKKLDVKSIYKYSLPVFIVLMTLTLFYSLDVVMVKHYFDEITAGYYTAFALLGRIAFFASFSIVFVMFPKVVEMHEQKKQNIHLLKKALGLVTVMCAGIIIVYALLNKLVVLILFGNQYLTISTYITPFAVIMSLFSYVYVLAFYNLSINKTKFAYYLIILNILEVILIIIFHDSLWQIITSLFILILITFIIMMIYTFTKNGKYISNNPGIQRRKKNRKYYKKMPGIFQKK